MGCWLLILQVVTLMVMAGRSPSGITSVPISPLNHTPALETQYPCRQTTPRLTQYFAVYVLPFLTSDASWVTPAWARENYAGTGSAVRQTPVHPVYALFGLPSIVTVPLASP